MSLNNNEVCIPNMQDVVIALTNDIQSIEYLDRVKS